MAKKATSTEFREEFWNIVFERAKGLEGPIVAKAFREAARDCWDAGMDEAWEKITKQSSGSAKRAFDVIWVAAVSKRLLDLKNKKRFKKQA